MRRASRVDENHGDIKAALLRSGASVQDLSRVGEGCPDLLVGIAGRNLLLECKDGNKPPSRRKLNKRQEKWVDGWAGHVCVVTSPEDALAAIGLSVGRI